MTLPADDPRHGTHNGYINCRCRCQPCRDAQAAAMRAYREQHKERLAIARRAYRARLRAARQTEW